MKIITLLLLLFSLSMYSQTTISGIITDAKGKPVSGANIFIEGSYDGATSLDDGSFTLTTTETGQHILIVSFLSFKTKKLPIDIFSYKAQTIVLRESVNTLDAVVITAGTLESGDKARVALLKPLDIVTTAGSAGDIVAALQTLPGTQAVGEDGRLFVRGGEPDEAQTFVDGIRVSQPYSATTANLPTRGRFSPFLFDGISFSTGGYSAEYGEALSSVLLLNTQDDPVQNQTNISLMTVGLGLGHTQKWDKSSLSLNVAYTDLAPYHWAVPQNVDWNRPYRSLAGEAVYRKHFTAGLLKVYAAFDAAAFDVNQQNIGYNEPLRVNLRNNNFYLNASYKGDFGTGWKIFTGLSYGFNTNNIELDEDLVENAENALHLKLKLSKKFSEHFRIAAGADYFLTDFQEAFRGFGQTERNIGYQSGITAAYAEADVLFSKKVAFKAGFRVSHNDLVGETVYNPRISMAYKFTSKSQVSLAYGNFAQAPKQEYLKFSDFHQFGNEKATHYILNYQYHRDKQTLRAEAYYKAYTDLVKYDSPVVAFNSNFSNQGKGYAQGVDLFWRDGRSFRNLEYWVSYSYIDSERDYRNYPVQATPSFIASHNLSVVTKYWIEKWRSQLGITNSFGSGRPYHDPNLSGFMQRHTKAYNSLNVSWAYLLSQQKILYFSMSNVLRTQNVFSYQYSPIADNQGVFQRQAIRPTADRFIFVGFFWTISQDKKTNQLNTL